MSEKNIIQKNPNTAGSIFMSMLTLVLILIRIPMLVPIITIVIGGRYTFKARDAKEDKKFLRIAYILFVLIFAFLVIGYILNIALFVINALDEAKV